MSFFFKENFTLEKGRGAWVYLFTIYLLYSFVTFLTPKGGGWHGFFFFTFCYFLYCVLSFSYHFLLLQGEGGVGLIFIFLIIIFYILNKILEFYFTF